MANISWNEKYQQLLLDKEVIEILLSSLSNANETEKPALSHSVIAVANLSSVQNFHEKARNL